MTVPVIDRQRFIHKEDLELKENTATIHCDVGGELHIQLSEPITIKAHTLEDTELIIDTFSRLFGMVHSIMSYVGRSRNDEHTFTRIHRNLRVVSAITALFLEQCKTNKITNSDRIRWKKLPWILSTLPNQQTTEIIELVQEISCSILSAHPLLQTNIDDLTSFIIMMDKLVHDLDLADMLDTPLDELSTGEAYELSTELWLNDLTGFLSKSNPNDIDMPPLPKPGKKFNGN